MKTKWKILIIGSILINLLSLASLYFALGAFWEDVLFGVRELFIYEQEQMAYMSIQQRSSQEQEQKQMQEQAILAEEEAERALSPENYPIIVVEQTPSKYDDMLSEYEMRLAEMERSLDDARRMIYDEYAITYTYGAEAESDEDAVEIIEAHSAPLSATDTPSEVDKFLEGMWDANISFNVPVNINIDDSPEIQLLLSSSHAIEELKKALDKRGHVSGQTIKVKDRVEAKLEGGDMFIITAITPEEQAISKTEITEWRWMIVPKEQGQHTLYLTLTVLLEVNGEETQRAIKTFERYIQVNVTTTQKISGFTRDNWQWLWAVIIFPVIGWLWRRKSQRM